MGRDAVSRFGRECAAESRAGRADRALISRRREVGAGVLGSPRPSTTRHS